MSVEEAISEAAKLGRSDFNNSIGVGSLEPVTYTLPACVDEEGRPLPRNVVKRSVEDYCHSQKLGILSHSIGIGLGTDFPVGFCITLAKCEEFLLDLGFKVKRDKSDFTIVVNVPGGEYTMTDTNRHALALRAIHFIMLRQDPDTDEYVLRRLFSEVNGLEDAVEV